MAWGIKALKEAARVPGAKQKKGLVFSSLGFIGFQPSDLELRMSRFRSNLHPHPHRHEIDGCDTRQAIGAEHFNRVFRKCELQAPIPIL